MDQHENHGNPAVEFVYLNNNDETRFHAHWTDTLQELWDRAYDELGESRRDGDEIECQSGESLMQYLGSSLEELRDRHLCAGHKFQIKCETGGA